MFFILIFSFCTSPTDTNGAKVKIDTLVRIDTMIRVDTLTDTITRYDTIYAPPILSGKSTVLGKPIINTVFRVNVVIDVNFQNLANAIGYREYVEIPGTGTYDITEAPFWISSSSSYEIDPPVAPITSLIHEPMIIYFYVVGIDSTGLDGPVSDAKPYMFYP